MGRIIPVTDFDDPALDIYARLSENQLVCREKPEDGLFIAESPKVIGTALDTGLEPVSFLMEQRHIAGDAASLLARFPDVPVYTAERELLARLTGYTLTRGVLCAMRRPAPKSPTEVIAGAKRIAVLEGVVDATNIGAIFRSAAALGMDAVLLSPTCCDPLTRRAVRVSMGTVFQLPWATFDTWPAGGMEILRGAGFATCAMALRDDSLALGDERLNSIPKLAIVLGAEGDGLANGTIAACDYTVRIPMAHGVDSLNVAAASAVAFWELRAKIKSRL